MALHDPPIEFPFVDLSTGMVTEPWQRWLIITKRDKANRVESGTENNIATLDSDGHPQDGQTSLPSGALVDTSTEQEFSNKTFAELTSTKILASNGSSGLSEIDLFDWVTAGAGITVTDDGDGTITIVVKNQSNVSDASTSHTITDPSDSPADADALRDDLVANAIPDIESALDALGTKINAVLALLLASEIMDSP